MTPLQYLQTVSSTIAKEVPRTIFYFFVMNQRCQTLLKDLYHGLLEPLSTDGVDIKDLGYHACIVYDILFASNYACESCHKESGNKAILSAAADIIETSLKKHGPDMIVRANRKNYQARAKKSPERV